MTTHRISANNLLIGMYVGQLDRPWLETPFLFQGFEIREKNEIIQLQQCCDFVYITPERSKISEKEILSASQKRSTRGEELLTSAKPQNNIKKDPPTAQNWLRRVAYSAASLDSSGKILSFLNSNNPYKKKTSVHNESEPAANAYKNANDTIGAIFENVSSGNTVNISKVKDAVTPLIESALRNENAIAWLAYLRKGDKYTYSRSISSSIWAILLGRHLGIDRENIDTIAMGAMLMDIGKLKLPPELLKLPRQFSEEEYTVYKQHVSHSLEIVRESPNVNPAIIEMIQHHHERHDGSGYPHGLQGIDIPIYSRIAGIVDTFDEMISHRPHAATLSSYDAIRKLNNFAGFKFQNELVEQFVQALGMFPTGSIVELNSGYIGIVTEQNKIHRLRPRLMLILNEEKQSLPECEIMDLRHCSSREGHPKSRWIVRGHEPGAFGINTSDYFI